MPIEVRELVIKATVSQDSNAGGNAGASPASNSANQEIVKLCVEKVLEIIKKKYGR